MKHYHVLMISVGLLFGACKEKDDKKPTPTPSDSFLTAVPGSWLYPDQDSILLPADGLLENTLRFEPEPAFDGTISYQIDGEQSSCDDSYFETRDLSPEGALNLKFKDDFTGDCDMTFVAQLLQGEQLYGESRKTIRFTRNGVNTLSFINLPTTIEVQYEEGLNFTVEATDGSDAASPASIRFVIEDNQCAAYFASEMPIAIDEQTGVLSGKPSQASPAAGCQLTIVAVQGEEGRSLSRARGQLTIIIPAFDPALSWVNTAEQSLPVKALQAVEHEVKAIFASSEGPMEAAISYSLFDNQCESGWIEAVSLDSATGLLTGLPANEGADVCSVSIRASLDGVSIEKTLEIQVDKITSLSLVDADDAAKSLTNFSMKLNETRSFRALGTYANAGDQLPLGTDLSSFEIAEGQDKIELTTTAADFQVKAVQTGKAVLSISVVGLQASLEIMVQDKTVQELYFALPNGEKLTQVSLRPGETYNDNFQLWYRYTDLQDEEKVEQVTSFTLTTNDESIVAVAGTSLIGKAPGRTVVRGLLTDDQFAGSAAAELAVFVFCQESEQYNPASQTCESQNIPQPAGDLFVSGPMLEKKRFSALPGFQACADIFQLESDWSYRRVVGCQLNSGETVFEIHSGRAADQATMVLERQASSCQTESSLFVAKEQQIRGDMINKDLILVSEAGEKPYLYGSRDYHTYNASCEDLLRHPDRSSSALIMTLCQQLLVADQATVNDSNVKKGCFVQDGDAPRFQAQQ